VSPSPSVAQTPDLGDIKLLLTDVDGTLVPDTKALTPATIEAAKMLRERNIELAVTSSRPPIGLRMLVAPLALTTPLAGFNGGVLADPHDLSIIESHPVDPAAAQAVVDFLHRQGLDIWVYTENEWFVRDPKGAHVEREAFILQAPPRVIDAFTTAQTRHAFKVVGLCDDRAKLVAAEQGARALLGDTASAARSSGHFLDVTHPLANKGCVVETLARRLGIGPHQIATIGDGDNDTLMFAKGGFSIAMGNADDDVKAKADAVTDSNNDDGWAKAVRKFLLKSDAA
jgi:Cof subfamily protein (haloacid dehalogenase superfamily)